VGKIVSKTEDKAWRKKLKVLGELHQCKSEGGRFRSLNGGGRRCSE